MSPTSHAPVLLLQPPPYNLTRLILTGFMGAGKTTLGKRLAKKIGYTFIDTDQDITQRLGMSVSAIFADRGEEGFRKLEAEAFQRALSTYNVVIATGGGTLANPALMEQALEQGCVVWLQASPQVLLDRVTRSHKDRPILRREHPEDDPHARFMALYDQRVALYEQAHVALMTDSLDALPTLGPPPSGATPAEPDLLDKLVDALSLPRAPQVPESKGTAPFRRRPDAPKPYFNRRP